MMTESKMSIDYPKLVDNAMKNIVKIILIKLAKGEINGDHYFLMSFITGHDGVELSPRLRKRYPRDMTIILQHQFEKLEVTEENVSVSLSFDGVKEKVVIPFSSIISFVDPSTKFALQFTYIEQNMNLPRIKSELPNETEPKKKNSKKTGAKSAEKVIILDNFRKNKK